MWSRGASGGRRTPIGWRGANPVPRIVKVFERLLQLVEHKVTTYVDLRHPRGAWAKSRSSSRIGASPSSEAPKRDGPDWLAGLGDDGEVGGDVVRRAGRPVLPRGDHRAPRRPGPAQLEAGRARLGHRDEGQRGDHAELPAARAAQRPEQLRLAVGVAVDQPPAGQDDARPASASEVSPYARPSRPSPPPRVRPAMPTVGPQPAGRVRACSCRPRTPAPAVRPRRSSRARPTAHRDAVQAARSSTTPSVEERPAKQCPPPRGTTCEPVSRA